MAEPIEGLYFNWLCAKVMNYQPHNAANYHDLMRILYTQEFTWIVRGDHNRADDGKELRIDFLREAGMHPDEEPEWFDQPCSILEMLIAFAKRAEFQTDIPYRKWFWTFLENLEINEYRRITSHHDLRDIEDKLNTFVERRYGGNGRGGLCPLRVPLRNQQEVEIWYQFFDYLTEQGI